MRLLHAIPITNLASRTTYIIMCWFNSNSCILPLSAIDRRVYSFKLEASASRCPASVLNPAPLPRGIREFPSMIVLVYFVRRDAACASLLWWCFHFGIHSFTGAGPVPRELTSHYLARLSVTSYSVPTHAKFQMLYTRECACLVLNSFIINLCLFVSDNLLSLLQ